MQSDVLNTPVRQILYSQTAQITTSKKLDDLITCIKEMRAENARQYTELTAKINEVYANHQLMHEDIRSLDEDNQVILNRLAAIIDDPRLL